MRRLLDQHGETLLETLTAVLIVSLCFVFLTTSVVTSSKISQASENALSGFMYNSNASAYEQQQVTVSDGSSKVPLGSCDVRMYQTADGQYSYYQAEN